MSYFQEIGLIDRPFVDLKISIRGKDVDVRARALSAKEADEIESLRMDEYGRLLTRFNESVDGGTSERERVTGLYATKSERELISQILPTREDEVAARALEASGIDFAREIAAVNRMETEEEREAYAKDVDERLEAAKLVAREDIRAELSLKSVDDLAQIMGQVNINIKAQRQSVEAYNTAFVYYALYRPDKPERVFDSVEQVAEELTDVKISEIVMAVQKALTTDLPFGSREDEEPNKPPSSPATSRGATKGGGTRTRTTKGASKRSSTPA